MTDKLPVLFAQLVPLALVVAWSPVKILPPLALVFAATRPRATSLAYLAGSMVSLIGATVLFVTLRAAPGPVGDVQWSTQGPGAWVRIGLGAVLMLLAGYAWSRRRNPMRTAGWLTGLTRVTPTVAAALAVSLTVLNPKVMVATAAAGLAIATASLGTVGTAGAVGGYTVLAGSTVIVPVVGYLVAAERADAIMGAIRRRIQRDRAAVTSVVLAVLGAAVATTGFIGI